MEPIEQVFLHVRSVGNVRSAEVTAATELVRSEDLSEIVSWFSDREDESILRFDLSQLFFHPLPSGDFAIGAIEPCQKNVFSLFLPPKSFFVRIFVVPARTLSLKGNNPISLYDELRRRKKFVPSGKAPKRLRPVVPSRNVELLNENILEATAFDPGPVAMTMLSQSLFDSECSFFSVSPASVSLKILAGLIELLPLRYRCELTFSSELNYSPNRSFRLIGVGNSRRQATWLSGTLGIPIVRLEEFRRDAVPPESRVLDPWPGFVFELFQTGQFSVLRRELEIEYESLLSATENDSTPVMSWNGLHEIAARRIRWFHDPSFSGDRHATDRFKDDALPTHEEFLRCSTTVGRILPMLDRENDDLSKKRQILESAIPPETKTRDGKVFSSENILDRMNRFPDLKDSFEELDSRISEILSGVSDEVSFVRKTWKNLCRRIPWEDRDRLREEYLGSIRGTLISPREDDSFDPSRQNARLLELMLVFLERPASPFSRRS